ncbi:hypothetical protein LUZ60_007724 [Juncus effusus]|nr:hypothetical protein LUZ60_007724 [Juncus effusus]
MIPFPSLPSTTKDPPHAHPHPHPHPHKTKNTPNPSNIKPRHIPNPKRTNSQLPSPPLPLYKPSSKPPFPMPRRSSIPPASPSSDPRPKARRKKRKQQQQDSDSDSDSALGASPSAVHGHGHGQADLQLDFRESEVVSGRVEKISDFPLAFKRAVNRPHHSVLSVMAAERRSLGSGWSGSGGSGVFMENVSHGQLQSTSAVVPENLVEGEKPPLFVCTPPQLMEGKGVMRKFEGGRAVTVPSHSEWFSPNAVHRLERQVVPHFFSGKSPSHTPEKYISLRNKIISKYLENPSRRLAFGECQPLVSNTNELYDLSRIVRFLDNWGIINYFAAGSVHRGLRMAAPLLREDPSTGELQLMTAPLKSIDSLMLFDRPKCSMKAEDLGSGSDGLLDLDSNGFADLDARIMEKLSDNSCSYCSVPLPGLQYQSQKEADVALCSNCYHDGKYVTGHSSLDFLRSDSKKDASASETEGDSWTDGETLLLLEGIEKHNDNWGEIAEHVGTKSKAQCIEHFIRMPVEDGLLEDLDVPETPLGEGMVPDGWKANGTVQEDVGNGSKFPFADAPNPVMSLVAFLTSAIGPRVAAACANAALCVLTKEDSRSNSDGTHDEAGNHGAHPNMHDEPSNPLSPEGVKYAAVCGLSAAAMKAKLFADQEEREIQRLSATIINHQLKRLELKLKQFAEIETLLLKECEQVDKIRQQISAGRARMMSGQVSRPTPSSPIPPSTTNPIPLNPNPNPNPRPLINSPLGMQPNMPAGMQQGGPHVQLQFMQRQQQQQMLSFGPRLPLSAIHPNLNAGAQNVGFNPNLLRPSAGNNSNVG